MAASLRVSAAVTTLSTSLRARPEGHSDPNGSRTGSQRAQSGPPEMAQSSQEKGCEIHRVPLARPRSCSGTSVFGRRSVVRPSRWSVGGESFKPLSVRSEVSRWGPSVFGRKRVVRAPQSNLGSESFGPLDVRSEVSRSSPSVFGGRCVVRVPHSAQPPAFAARGRISRSSLATVHLRHPTLSAEARAHSFHLRCGTCNCA